LLQAGKVGSFHLLLKPILDSTMFFSAKSEMITPSRALAGRSEAIQLDNRHYVLNTPLLPPFPENLQQAVFAMGCFWGAERKFWTQDGVFSTAVGYTAGYTPNPTYQEVCSGQTGHTEAVLVVFDAAKVSYDDLLKVFWESHNPTQGMQQGNDSGTQYRSGVYVGGNDQTAAANASLEHYQDTLRKSGAGSITTEVQTLDHFYYAEDYHQQYLAKNPGGYCGLGGTGVKYCG
jgi:peptide-methionine (S)-S-oxide reductase